MHNKSIHIAIGMLFLTFMVGCSGFIRHEDRHSIDALNERAYTFRYIDIDTVYALSNQALALSGEYANGRNEARLNLAFVAYQQMDFDGVDSILELVRNDSHNQLLLLCADVMQMKKCQRTSEGGRFFQAKSRAETRMKRIQEEQEEISTRDLSLWVYAQTEFYIIVSTYYVYQEQYAMAQAELAKVLPCLDMRVDTAQWIYYNYMLGPGGLVEGESEEDITLQEFDYLYRAYNLSRRLGIRYFEANSLQALATMCMNHDSLVSAKRPEAFQLLSAQNNVAEQEDADLPIVLAQRALALFQGYKDIFQSACTYRTLGEIHFNRGHYDQALANYDQALHLVNVHHLRYYGALSPDTLSGFNPHDLRRSIEMEWIADPHISTVPDWIAGIRQQFSLTFSALGHRQESDYNRNLYLDLIQATNQNLEWENRTAELKHQTHSLYKRIGLSLLLMSVALILFLLFRFRLKRQSRDNIREVDTALALFHGTTAPQSPSHASALSTPFLRACQDFVKWNQDTLAAQEEERDELKEQLQMSIRRMADNKRRNAENRAKVSLVHGIIPFLDRIGGEVVRMKREGTIAPTRREYIVELVDQIEQYNAILTDWIQMERGQLSLHISTFPLQKLFQIIAEGHYGFDQKHIELHVEPTQASVKADESLTLFMMNTLCDNARKFTPEGGSVTLSAEEMEDCVEVRVADTGVGLSAEDVDTLNHSKVYDSSQIGSHDDEHRKGFGFGLMNCRGIIEKYKKTSPIFACCTFGVKSQLGQGSTFFFRLPRIVHCLMLFCLIPFCLHAQSEEAVYYDSLYQANLDGRYAATLQHADRVLQILNEAHPDQPPLLLVDSVRMGTEHADLQWAKSGIDADYDLIVGLRNEVALAALAMRDWHLYHYNNDVCIRLHRYLNQDNTLPDYYHRLERTHQNSNLMLVLIILSSLLILVLSYKLLVRGQMKKEREMEAKKHYLLHLLEVARQQPQEQAFLSATAEHPGTKSWATECQQAVAALSIRPMQDVAADRTRIADELARMNYEENRLYIQNQILDNCLSTIKHESMYYPSRIRQLAERISDEDIGQLAELVQYYHHIYTLLCRQADEQLSQPGFKRQHLLAQAVLDGWASIARRLGKRWPTIGQPLLIDNTTSGTTIMADEALLNTMLESLYVGMAHDGAILEIEGREEGRFVCFTLRDRSVNLTDEALADLFFPDASHISYLVAKQILREHDTYLNHPGCRLNARQAEGGGYEIFFTLMKGVGKRD